MSEIKVMVKKAMVLKWSFNNEKFMVSVDFKGWFIVSRY